jgi:isopenicillin-N epimerase
MGQRQGYKYINHPISLPVTTPEAFVERLWEGVTARTRVIFISHITSPTALIFPVQEVCRRAREQGILTVIDGAHAPGQIPLRLDELGADFYSGNLHKWVCTPKGTGFLYARAEMMRFIEPLVVSWGYQSDQPGPSRLVDYVEMQGTRDLSAFLAVPDAIRYLEDHNWNAVRDRCHAILEQTVQEIAEMSGKQPISPLHCGWFSQMASAPLPDTATPAELHQQLYDEYRIEIPVMDWNGHKLTRISFQAYNTAEDARALVEALKRLLKC